MKLGKKHFYIGIPSLAALFIVVWLLFFNKTKAVELSVKPTRGTFNITVTTTGELQAKSSIEVFGPENARSAGIWQMKISKIIPEGTIVKKGDFVAELDKAEIMNKIKEIDLSIQKYESQYLQAKLDSTLNLSSSRDELENLKFSVEEKKLQMEQSKFEAPAIIRQAEIDYDRAQRSFSQSLNNYATKVQKAIATLQIVGSDLSKEKQKMDIMMQTLQQFNVTAPADGMVIYDKEWNGKKKAVGATISPWDPTVAKLPDLTKMESITYVNEVDIQKIRVDQFVRISFDADPKKKLTGKVVKVANIGEQRPNSDSKVFEVNIDVTETDTTLRPSMTTSNEILVAQIKNTLYIPLEAIHYHNDKAFVFKKSNGNAIKQEVKLGQTNENSVIILKGLNDKDELLLNIPENAEKIKLARLK